MTLPQPRPRLPRMTADEFMVWVEAQPDGERYELVAGEIVGMTNERMAHARVKLLVVNALSAAIRGADLRCEAIPDGMTVRIDPEVVYGPDALVRCGKPLPDDTVEIVDPVIVVEVVSPSSGGRDRGAKLEGYFRIPTLRHYLIVDTKTRKVIHHRRDDDGGPIATSIVAAGALDLTPPGLSVTVASLFPTA